MNANANRGVLELNSEELELVSGGGDAFTDALRTYNHWIRVACDYYFNADGGKVFYGK